MVVRLILLKGLKVGISVVRAVAAGVLVMTTAVLVMTAVAAVTVAALAVATVAAPVHWRHATGMAAVVIALVLVVAASVH